MLDAGCGSDADDAGRLSNNPAERKKKFESSIRWCSWASFVPHFGRLEFFFLAGNLIMIHSHLDGILFHHLDPAAAAAASSQVFPSWLAGFNFVFSLGAESATLINLANWPAGCQLAKPGKRKYKRVRVTRVTPSHYARKLKP